VVLSLVSSFIVVASAHSGSVKTRQITGNVTAIDTKSNTVTIEKKNSRVTVSVSEKSNIIQCSPGRSISDIVIGHRVTAKYVEDDENRARSITIRDDSR
jgi:hypothetical protein